MILFLLACAVATLDTAETAAPWPGYALRSTTWEATAADCDASPEAGVALPFAPVVLMQVIACDTSGATGAARECWDATDMLSDRVPATGRGLPIPCPGSLTVSFVVAE